MLRFIPSLALLLLVQNVFSHDWAVEVSSKAAADLIASDNGLLNAGEVIPETGIYHLKTPQHHRAARSADDIHAEVEAHPEAKWVELQDQPLSRKRRVPLERQGRQANSELCFVNTVATEDKESRRCVFPFSFQGKDYVKCTTDHSENGRAWCATEVMPDGEVIQGQWGDCDLESLSCFRLKTGETIVEEIGKPQAPAARPPPPARRPPPPQPQSPRIPSQLLQQQQTPRRPPPPQRQQIQLTPEQFQQILAAEQAAQQPPRPRLSQAQLQQLAAEQAAAQAPRLSQAQLQQLAAEQAAAQAQQPQRPRLTQAQLQQLLAQQQAAATQRGPPPQSARPPPPFLRGQGGPPAQGPTAGGPPPRRFIGQDGQSISPQQLQQLLAQQQQFQRPPQGLGRFPPPGAFPPGRFPPSGFGPPGLPRRPPQQEPDWEFIAEQTPPTKTKWNDEAWPAMWFLNRGQPGMDMGVEDAWEQGYSGKGVKVTILDDGIEKDHPDLNANYDPLSSIDINDEDGDPTPRYDPFNSNKHGTRCAGTVAAVGNNSGCAVGVAYNAKIGGVRILDGQILDILEAKALSFNRDHIDIYSASWGPDDNGATVDGPGLLARKALELGAKNGRNGKGSIFVWASGNGGKKADSCNSDGYSTSIYTLSVSSTSENGLIPWYAEKCSSSLATTYSSGASKLGERKVVTTDLKGKCTDSHTGTSASSPMAAGMVALALEANPDLTWRDVQHLVVRNALPEGNLKQGEWGTNGVGLRFSPQYGFGLMDAGAMTRMAKDWQTVPEQQTCTTQPGVLAEPVVINANMQQLVDLDVIGCDDLIKHIEHVHLHIKLSSTSQRGKLKIVLKSPAGTESTLLEPRPFDIIRTGLELYDKWPMMSVHFWGEKAKGSWGLMVINADGGEATLHDFQLTFYGTQTDPQPDIPLVPRQPPVIGERPTQPAEGRTVVDEDVTTFRPNALDNIPVVDLSNIPGFAELEDEDFDGFPEIPQAQIPEEKKPIKLVVADEKEEENVEESQEEEMESEESSEESEDGEQFTTEVAAIFRDLAELSSDE